MNYRLPVPYLTEFAKMSGHPKSSDSTCYLVYCDTCMSQKKLGNNFFSKDDMGLHFL